MSDMVAFAYSRPPPPPKMPPGLRELMEELTREVLRHGPEDVHGFCANHMKKLLEIRDGPRKMRPLTLKEKQAKALKIVRYRTELRMKKMDIPNNFEKCNAEDESVKAPIFTENYLKEGLELELFDEDSKIFEGPPFIKNLALVNPTKKDISNEEPSIGSDLNSTESLSEKQDVESNQSVIDKKIINQLQSESTAIPEVEADNVEDTGSQIIDDVETKDERTIKIIQNNENTKIVSEPSKEYKENAECDFTENETGKSDVVSKNVEKLNANAKPENGILVSGDNKKPESGNTSESEEKADTNMKLENGSEAVSKNYEMIKNDNSNAKLDNGNILVSDNKEKANEIEKPDNDNTSVSEIDEEPNAKPESGNKLVSENNEKANENEKLENDNTSVSRNNEKANVNDKPKNGKTSVIESDDKANPNEKSENDSILVSENVDSNENKKPDDNTPVSENDEKANENDKPKNSDILVIENDDKANTNEKSENDTSSKSGSDKKAHIIQETERSGINQATEMVEASNMKTIIPMSKETANNANIVATKQESNENKGHDETLALVINEPCKTDILIDSQIIDSTNTLNTVENIVDSNVDNKRQAEKTAEHLNAEDVTETAKIIKDETTDVTNSSDTTIDKHTLNEISNEALLIDATVKDFKTESVSNSIEKIGHTSEFITENSDKQAILEVVNNGKTEIEEVTSDLGSINPEDISDLTRIDEVESKQKEDQEQKSNIADKSEIAAENLKIAQNVSNAIITFGNGNEESVFSDNIQCDVSSSNDDTIHDSLSGDDSQNIGHTTMDLETAAVTIQKVFRSFLFKSRNSTFDDAASDESIIDKDNIKEEDNEFLTQNEINKERRTLGRMDSVLQTVNEEKSLSLSTDDSSTLSSAATTIQAHVRGFLVRNKLGSEKTASTISLGNSNPSESTDIPEQVKTKTVLNIHIVPESAHYVSRDDSLLASMDLSMDGSPRASSNLHPLGYDKSERRKQLKREDAIQSVSPPSNNSGKLSEDVDSVKEMALTNVEAIRQISADTLVNKNDDKLNTDSRETTPTLSVTEDTVKTAIETKEDQFVTDTITEAKADIDEFDVVTPFHDDTSIGSGDSKLLHSGEFHDAVLPTKVSRNDSVIREFKNVLVYFLIWK